MICADTTVLIDEFRAKGNPAAPVNRALLQHSGEELVIPIVAAGEFLDGAAFVSEQRCQEALILLRQRRTIAAGLDVAGRSHHELWIAATARSLGARLLTRNAEDFHAINGLEVLSYGK